MSILNETYDESEVFGNSYLMFQAIPKGELYRDLFATVIYIVKTFRIKGYMNDAFPIEMIHTNYKSSKRLLQIAINLICNGVGEERFEFAIELEFNRLVYLSKFLIEEELSELTLAKKLINCIRNNQPDAIYNLLTYVCNSNIRDELVPNPDWA